jgi:hypothetical protein
VIYCESFITSFKCDFMLYVISLRGLLYRVSDGGKYSRYFGKVVVNYLFAYCADSLSSAGSGQVD